MLRNLICSLLFVAACSCQASAIEREFFRGDISTRVERLESYPLEQQWQIFLFGSQRIHPPVKSLALPIAKQGKPALDYIIQQLRESKNEPDFRDSMVVFERMQRGDYYDICEDPTAMEAIKSNQYKISHPGWREVYNQMLEDLCR